MVEFGEEDGEPATGRYLDQQGLNSRFADKWFHLISIATATLVKIPEIGAKSKTAEEAGPGFCLRQSRDHLGIDVITVGTAAAGQAPERIRRMHRRGPCLLLKQLQFGRFLVGA